MTIPKNAGLSHLADVAREAYGVELYYPIKKRRQPRRLDPNWAGIEWLEQQSETDTEISEEYDAGEYDGGETVFRVQRALGWNSARRMGMYPWPMFQCFPAVSFKASMFRYLDPCPDCDDWSRTSKCEVHHDRDGVAGLKMGHERRNRRIVDATPPERRLAMADYFRQVVDNSEARYTPNDGRRYFTQADQDVERRRQARLYTQAPCTCSMCTGRTQDPNEGRPGYHYNLASDRWERDTNDALGDFRAGGSITINNATIEVNGETVQGIQSFTIHIEGDARE